jgi:uncharacterized glyoxalase superfamily protein PhnB
VLGHPIRILRSFDDKRTKDFYLDFLGFELVFETRFEERAPLYMAVRQGDCVLHLSEHYGDATPGAAMRIPVEDVAEYTATLRAKENGNCRPGEPQLTAWGSREITLRDPSSNALTFFTPALPDSADAAPAEHP